MRKHIDQTPNVQSVVPAELAKLIRYLIARDIGSSDKWSSYEIAKSEISELTAGSRHLFETGVKLYTRGVSL